MFSTITTAPSTTMPKSSAPSDSRFAGMPLRFRQMDANSSEKGMVSATMNAPRILPRKINRISGHQHDSFGQVPQHRVRGVVHQIAAIEKRNDFHARRAGCDCSAHPLCRGWPPASCRNPRLCAAGRFPPPHRCCRRLCRPPGDKLCRSAPGESSDPGVTVAMSPTRMDAPFCAFSIVF